MRSYTVADDIGPLLRGNCGLRATGDHKGSPLRIDAVPLHHFVVDLNPQPRAFGEIDMPIHQWEALLCEGLVEGGVLDAVFEEVGAGEGGQEVE